MNRLSKKNRENVASVGMFRSLNQNQLIALEKSIITGDKGLTPEASEVALELSSACNKFNELKAGGKKMPKIMEFLETKIKDSIKQLENLGYCVESMDNGAYYIKPNVAQQIEMRATFS